MRADEAIKQPSFFESSLINYINQLRYERLMWKAEAIRNIDIEWLFDNTDLNNSKPLGTVLSQLEEIAEALGARARRIKEGM